MIPLVRHAVLMLDDDDPMLGGYTDIHYPPTWWLRIGKRAGLAELYNRFFRESPGHPWYGIFADDVLPEGDWDARLIAAAGSDGVAYGDDGIGACTHFCIGGDLVREIGWLALPGLDRLYIDTTWQAIAESRGVLRYLPDVKVTHMHPSAGRGMMDAIYRKPDDVKAADRAVYEAFRESSL